MIGSIFAKKNNENEEYLSIAYTCFIVLVLINGITLGTWSFSTDAPSIPIIERITSMFQITEHAGLLEMFGQLLITCVMADKYIVMTYKTNDYKACQRCVVDEKRHSFTVAWHNLNVCWGGMD